MRRFKPVHVGLVLAIVSEGAFAKAPAAKPAGDLPAEEVQFDTNHDKSLDAEEYRILKLHMASKIFRDYDLNPIDGILEDNEVQKMESDALTAVQNPSVIALTAKIDSQLRAGGGQVPIKDVKLPKLDDIDATLAASDELLNPECELKDRLFIRRDKVDMSIYTKKLGVNEKKGASLVVNRDYVANATSATVDAAAAFVLFRDACRPWGPNAKRESAFVAGYSLATYTELSGDLVAKEDKSDKSSARFGLDGQLELQGGGHFQYQYLTGGSYVQTDFRGEALAFGVEATWEPVNIDFNLGASARNNSWLDWYWTPILRVDALNVSDPGQTGLEKTKYVWLGGDIELTAIILPAQLEDRLYAKVGASLYWDAAGSKSAQLYTAGLFYNLDKDGNSSVSTEYKYGTDRTILKHEESITTSLNFKY